MRISTTLLQVNSRQIVTGTINAAVQAAIQAAIQAPLKGKQEYSL